MPRKTACRSKKSGRYTKCRRKSTSRKASQKSRKASRKSSRKSRARTYDGHFLGAGLGLVGQGIGAGISGLGGLTGAAGSTLGLVGQGIASPYIAPVVGAGLLGYGAKKAIGRSCTLYPYTAQCMVNAKLLKEGDQIRDPDTGLMHCVKAKDGLYGKSYEFGDCTAPSTPSYLESVARYFQSPPRYTPRASAPSSKAPPPEPSAPPAAASRRRPNRISRGWGLGYF